MSNKTYDVVKWIAMLLLPALGTLYFALAGLWHLPKTEEIVGTITAVDAFLGALLHISGVQYSKDPSNYDGQMVVNTSDPEKDVYSMEVNGPVEDLATKDVVKFKVNTTTNDPTK